MWKVNFILTQYNLPEAVPYFCMRCKNRLFHINREILVLWMGTGYPEREIPKNMGFIEHKCKGCEMVYSLYFQ